jgi:hypothetical protein
MQEAILNTAVKIKSCTRASAAGKNEYNLERTKNREKDILVLEKNEMPEAKAILSKEQKKEIKSLQTKLSTYKKRLEKAIKDGKEKSIKTNTKNIDKITKQLSKLEKSDNREKHFTEFTIALTNSKAGEYSQNWSEKALEHIKQEFPTLQVVSAVEHKDQHSPHMHILLYSDGKPITQVLAEQSGKSDTKRESMKEAYSTIAHKFHSFANENIAHKELKPLQKGRKYVSLGQYKQKGNFELKKALRDKKETLPALTIEDKQLSKRLIDANIHLKVQDIGEHSLEVHTSKVLFGEKHFITQADIDRKKDSLQAYADNAGEILDTDTSSVKKSINDYFKNLENNSKKTKDKQQPHFSKEPVLKINLDYFKNWRKDFNEYLKALDKNVKKVLEIIKDKKVDVQSKINKHPKTIEKNLKEKLQKEKSSISKPKDKNKSQGMSR